MGSAKALTVFCLLLLVAGCGGMLDDLAPSGSDRRPAVEPGIIGPWPSQQAPDFTLADTLGGSFTLSSSLTSTGTRGVVIYFTMWCPVCDTHMSALRSSFIPGYPDVRFLAIDYVSGSVADARNAEISSGYAGSGFTVLADIGQIVLNRYQATMGTTVVVDGNGIVRMNEDFKDGSRLSAVLSSLP